MRRATEADIPRIVDMVEALRASVEGPLPVHRPWTSALLKRLIVDPKALVLVTDGGFIAALLEPTIINPNPVAMELGWWSTDRSGLKLLKALEQWAWENGAILVKLSTAPRGLDLSRFGYRATELAWVK